MFIEHLGNLINHGLWSELLDDRKFYYRSLRLSPRNPQTLRRFAAARRDAGFRSDPTRASPWTRITHTSAITVLRLRWKRIRRMAFSNPACR